METLFFADGLKLGIPEMDDQHARFFDVMNRLIAADVESDERELVAGVLDELRDYVRGHFAAEEDLMARCGYPELPEHCAEHARFTAQLREFEAQFAEDEEGLDAEMMGALVEWFTNHIRQEDPKYVPVCGDPSR